MNLTARYEICSPGVICENFDGDVVILNLDDGCYFSLEGCAPVLWKAVLDGVAPQSIIRAVLAARPELAESTAGFLNKLCELRLIRTTAAPPTPLAEPLAFGEQLPSAAPGIEVFDDLAELILADPIHDVDAEAGWPIRKAA